jgi:hypothetical protein
VENVVCAAKNTAPALTTALNPLLDSLQLVNRSGSHSQSPGSSWDAVSSRGS